LVVVVAAWAALVVGAVYALRAVRNIWHGALPERWASEKLSDARDVPGWSVFNVWRKLPFLVLVSCLLLFGVWPQLLVDRIEPGVARILKCEPKEIKRPAGKRLPWLLPAPRKRSSS
jgi:NADH:ubiquinone oxidoreductase subunit 4 (subunit M)